MSVGLKRFAGVIMIVIGIACLAFGIFMFTGNDGRAGSLWLAFGIVMGFFLCFGGIGAHLMAGSGTQRHGTENRRVSSDSPALRYEGGAVRYCPVCHANLGTDVPDKCPECGRAMRGI